MITLNRTQLQVLADDADTIATLEGMYKWRKDVGIQYSDKLQLLANENVRTPGREKLLNERRRAAAGAVIMYLRRWAGDYSYVESPFSTQEGFLEALMLCVCKQKHPDAWAWPSVEPVVYLWKYPKLVHNRELPKRDYSHIAVEALRAFNWVDRAYLSNYLEDSKFEWSSADLNVLAYVLRTYSVVEAFTSTSIDSWKHRYEEFMPDLIKCIQIPEFAQDVYDTVHGGPYNLKEAEAVVAVRKADELLWRFAESIKADLKYNQERFGGYKAYTLCEGTLCRDEGQFLGRMVAWERSIKTNGNDSFMVVAVWEPSKKNDPRHYYLVKE